LGFGLDWIGSDGRGQRQKANMLRTLWKCVVVGRYLLQYKDVGFDPRFVTAAVLCIDYAGTRYKMNASFLATLRTPCRVHCFRSSMALFSFDLFLQVLLSIFC
jgi:hypothetical protein